jgi:NADH-quinone oxidoreductase subunit C
MHPREIAQLLSDRFGPAILAGFGEDRHPRVHVGAEHWVEIAKYCKGEPRLALDWLACASGMDYIADGKLAMVFDLWSFSHRHHFAVKVFCSREVAEMPSVAGVWAAANWHRRILLSDDWVGFPLRKDYIFPTDYHGIPGTVNYDFQAGPAKSRKNTTEKILFLRKFHLPPRKVHRIVRASLKVTPNTCLLSMNAKGWDK